MKPMHRLLASIVVLATLATAVPAYAARPLAAPRATVTLNIATVNNPQMIDMEHLTPLYFEKQYGIKVNFVTLPENTIREKITQDVATGGGQFDLATVGTYEVPIFAKNGWLANLDPQFNGQSAAAKASYDLGDVLGQVKRGLSYKNSLYALPFYGESSMTFYNKALFSKAHLTMPLHPSWDQIKSFAAKLTDKSKNQYGIVLRGLPGWGEMGAPMTTVINAFGGSWFDMNWTPQLTSPDRKSVV